MKMSSAVIFVLLSISPIMFGQVICTTIGTLGPDVINGTNGPDAICGDSGNDTITANSGNDFVNGQAGDDSINGNQGNDFLRGGKGSDTIRGGMDNDVLVGDRDGDFLFGDHGNDIYIYEDAFGGLGGLDEISDIGGFDRILIRASGLPGVNRLKFSQAQNDLLVSVAGTGVPLYRIVGYFSGQQIEAFHLGAQVALTLNPIPTNNPPFGHAGIGGTHVTGWAYDINSSSPRPIVVELVDAFGIVRSTTTTLASLPFPGLVGQIGPLGETPTNFCYFDVNLNISVAGYYTIRVSALDDQTGLPTQILGSPSSLTWLGTNSADSYLGTVGDDSAHGGDGNDILRGRNGDDFLQGNMGRDTLSGELGDDTIFGGRDADVLLGGPGEDELSGNLGDDILFGGPDDDKLFGGLGNDRFIWNVGDGNDEISGGTAPIGGADFLILRVPMSSVIEATAMNGLDKLIIIGAETITIKNYMMEPVTLVYSTTPPSVSLSVNPAMTTFTIFHAPLFGTSGLTVGEYMINGIDQLGNVMTAFSNGSTDVGLTAGGLTTNSLGINIFLNLTSTFQRFLVEDEKGDVAVALYP